MQDILIYFLQITHKNNTKCNTKIPNIQIYKIQNTKHKILYI